MTVSICLVGMGIAISVEHACFTFSLAMNPSMFSAHVANVDVSKVSTDNSHSGMTGVIDEEHYH